ncbi:hypothetical protein FWH13_02625 [Candidatus Saccharibacteria bacterium]|nr:hypothetical protein [Candidatus Saccharibacteria bacterium]
MKTFKIGKDGWIFKMSIAENAKDEADLGCEPDDERSISLRERAGDAVNSWMTGLLVVAIVILLIIGADSKVIWLLGGILFAQVVAQNLLYYYYQKKY